MIELKPKRIEEIKRMYTGDTVMTIVFEKVPNSTLDKLYPLKGKSLQGMVCQWLKKRKKRSLDANAYCWVLCDKIAEKIRSTKEEVYRSAIRAVGVFSDVAVEAEAVESLVSGWGHNQIGWFAEPIGTQENMKVLRLYYGSSTYDTKQMARLIDEIIVYCRDFDIEYLPPDELEKMKQLWGAE